MNNIYSRVELTPGTEIVAAMIDTMITNDRIEIARKIQDGKDVILLTRLEMKFMAAADLGENWRNLAEGPTLIKISEEAKP